MSNIVIATPDLSDDASLTAGSEAGSLVVGNLQTLPLGKVWRADDLNNAYVEIDHGSAKEINLVALLGTNGSSNADWRVRGATSQANLTSSPGYDSGSVSLWPTTGLGTWSTVNAILWLGSNSQTFRWWRIDVDDTGNGDGFFQAGRLYIENAWQPTTNISLGWDISWKDFGLRPRALGGQLNPRQRSRARVLQFSLEAQSESDLYDNAFDTDRRHGTTKDMLVIRDPGNSSYLQHQTIYGLQEELPGISNNRVNLYAKRFQVEEITP